MGRIVTLAMVLTVFSMGKHTHADIIQSLENGATTISLADPIGQSFTAVDSLIESVGFGISVANSVGAAALTVTLYDGAGFGGAVLDTQTIGLASVVSAADGAWNDFVFNSPVPLTVGNVYTAQISTTSIRWALNFSSANPYAGGTYYVGGNPISDVDAKFRVLAADPIPAPGAALLAMIGLGMAPRFKRRFQ